MKYLILLLVLTGCSPSYKAGDCYTDSQSTYVKILSIESFDNKTVVNYRFADITDEIGLQSRLEMGDKDSYIDDHSFGWRYRKKLNDCYLYESLYNVNVDKARLTVIEHRISELEYEVKDLKLFKKKK